MIDPNEDVNIRMRRHLVETLASRGTEAFVVVFFNEDKHLLAEEMMAEGGPDAVHIPIDEIIRRAKELGAKHLILVHNHREGTGIEPSVMDELSTINVGLQTAMNGILVQDHLVVGTAPGHPPSVWSMRLGKAL